MMVNPADGFLDLARSLWHLAIQLTPCRRACFAARLADSAPDGHGRPGDSGGNPPGRHLGDKENATRHRPARTHLRSKSKDTRAGLLR